MENIVKTWEMEISHKADMNQWTTIDKENYKLQVNNGPTVDGKEVFQIGTYNFIMRECPAYQKCILPILCSTYLLN